MALSNFLLTVAAVGAGFVLLKGDVRRSAVNLRRNLKHVRHWLEQEQASSAAASKYASSLPFSFRSCMNSTILVDELHLLVVV
jgi:hypothetical protein